VVVAAALALLASVFFNRFDAGGQRWLHPSLAGSQGSQQDGTLTADLPQNSGPPGEVPLAEVTKLTPVAVEFQAINVLRAELRLLLKGQPGWWYAGAAGLILAGLLVRSEPARQIVLPIAWIWPALIWSGLGSREARHATGAVVFSAARPLARQLPSIWLAGVVVSALAGSGVFMTLARTGDLEGVLAWAGGALFIPALALALGAWSGGSKLFEVVYVVWWYSGPLNGLSGLDFMGARQPGLWLTYLLLALLLLVAAAIARWRQINFS
jgi:hypothetical protein